MSFANWWPFGTGIKVLNVTSSKNVCIHNTDKCMYAMSILPTIHIVLMETSLNSVNGVVSICDKDSQSATICTVYSISNQALGPVLNHCMLKAPYAAPNNHAQCWLFCHQWLLILYVPATLNATTEVSQHGLAQGLFPGASSHSLSQYWFFCRLNNEGHIFVKFYSRLKNCFQESIKNYCLHKNANFVPASMSSYNNILICAPHLRFQRKER